MGGGGGVEVEVGGVCGTARSTSFVTAAPGDAVSVHFVAAVAVVVYDETSLAFHCLYQFYVWGERRWGLVKYWVNV